jgi:hypothetical protein
MLRYTVTHKDTHERLFPGDGEKLDKVLAILRGRTHVVVDGERREFLPWEWYVTAWNTAELDGYGEFEIIGSVSADEFMDDPRAVEV